MGLYNFKPQFERFIAAGSKTHTIRAPRKLPDQAGRTMFLYTGLRRKGARLLMRATCVKVEAICISPSRAGYAKVCIDGVFLSDSEKEALARRDGFRDFGD